MFSEETHRYFINRFFFRSWCQTCVAGRRDRWLETILLCSLYSLYSLILAFVYSSSVPEYLKLFSAVSVGLAEHINTERWQGFAAVGNKGMYNCIIVSHSAPTCNLLKCHFMLQALTLPFPVNLIQPALSHHDRGAWARRAPASRGDSYSGITDPWPGYCCLWYLLVNFRNQYNINPPSSWEWKPETVHLILKPAPAPCSAAKLGSWPTWCSIIAAEVRCEPPWQVLMNGCLWWSTSSIQQETFNNDGP